VLSGRYGPYVKHGDTNATLPRAKEPAALTMDEAVQLIAERVAKGPSKPKGRRIKKAPAKNGTAQSGEGSGEATKAKAAPKSAKPKKPKPGGTREAAE
jgi:DNA topoisomerase-1